MQKTLRILNLEDNPNDSELIQARLEEERLPCEITRVETEPDFVAALAQKDRFDLILADYKLPSFEGLRALAVAQEKSPEIPFILISGTIGEELAIESMKKGAADYILKDKLFRLGPAVRRALKEAEEKSELRRAEEALRETDKRFRLFYENAPIAYQSLDSEGKFIEVNQSWLDLLGYKREEVIGKWFGDFLVPEQVELFRERFPKFKAAGVTHGVEFGFMGKDGRRVIVTIDGRIGKDENGAFRQTHCVLHDISERKRAEQALRESSQFNRQIIDSAQEGIVVYGPDLKYLVWNPFMEQLTGIPASDVIGRHPLDVFPFLKDVGVIECAEKALRGEIAEARRFPFAVPKTGRSGWTSDKSAPLRNSRGEIVGVIATVRDITEHVRAEEAQRLSEAKYLLLNEGIMDGFVSVDMKGNMLEFNRAYRDMLGYSEEELRKRTYIELTPLRWHEVERKIIEDQIMKRGFSDIYEKEYIRKDGTVFPVEFRTYLIRDADSKPVGMWGIVRDITGRKKTESRLRELNACFLEFGADPGENIDRLVALCGKLLEGSCALYNRLDRDMLCSRGKWNVPLDYPAADAPEGHICYDVIRKAGNEVFVVRNLPETDYARTDPNVNRYNLETYVGVAVKFAGSSVGALCVVYERDFLPDEEDKRLLGIIASAIGVEEERKIGEQSLATAGREWSASFDAMADGVSVHTPDHVIANVNQSLCLMLGKSREELIGKKCYEIFHGQDSPIEDCPLGRSKESKQKEYLEIFEPTIDKWLAVSTAPILDDSDSVIRIVHTVRDITGRKQSEEKLREEIEVSDSLLQIVEALNATLDEKALVQTLTQITPRYLKFDRVSVFLGDEDLDTFTFSGGYGFAPPQEGYLLSKVFRKGDFPAVDKLLNGETICIENARETDLLPKDLVNTLELGSTIMVPVSYRGTISGAIVGTYRAPNALKLKDLTLLKGLADGIGVALQNSRLYRESTHRLMQLSGKMETIKAMAQLDREILVSTDRKTILQTATALVNRIIPCERVAIVLMEGDYYSVATEWGLGQFAGRKYPVKGSHCEAFRQNQMSIYSPDISGEKCAYHSEQSLLGIKSVLLVPLVTRDGVAGFLDLGTSHHGKLTPADLSTAESIASQIAVALENARLFEDLQQLLVNTITSLASAIDAKSPWTKGHSERVTKYAVEIGEEMGLTEHELERLKLSGLLHDVGKIGTYDILLDKPSKLTDEEFELVKKHPRKGAEILSPIKQLTDIIPGVHHHHERYDGRGYPDGLAGDDIPLQARILCVADSFDSMTADRPYRPAPGTAYAISEFKRCRGTQFDPVVVEAFLRVLGRRDSNGPGKTHE